MREGDDCDCEGDDDEPKELLLLLREGLNRNKVFGFIESVGLIGNTSGSATKDTRYLMELGVGDLDPENAEGYGDLPVEESCDPSSS